MKPRMKPVTPGRESWTLGAKLIPNRNGHCTFAGEGPVYFTPNEAAGTTDTPRLGPLFLRTVTA